MVFRCRVFVFLVFFLYLVVIGDFELCLISTMCFLVIRFFGLFCDIFGTCFLMYHGCTTWYDVDAIFVRCVFCVFLCFIWFETEGHFLSFFCKSSIFFAHLFVSFLSLCEMRVKHVFFVSITPCICLVFLLFLTCA